MLIDTNNFFEKYRKKHFELEGGAKRRNTTVAICNQKGGCAKTTTAINLSSCIAQKGYKVMIVDLDPQAHASLGLGIDSGNLGETIYDVLAKKKEIEAVIRRTSVENLDIVPANSLLSGSQLELAGVLGRETVLKAALRKLRQIEEYDFIFLDCSPSLNLVTINALTAADSVLIPVQAQYYSLEGMKELFNTIGLVKERLNFELEILGILPTLFDSRTRMSHELMQQLRDFFKEMVFKTVIRNNVKLCEAPMFKKPIHLYDPHSQGAKDYTQLSEEVIALIYSLQGQEVSASAAVLTQDKLSDSDIAILDSISRGGGNAAG